MSFVNSVMLIEIKRKPLVKKEKRKLFYSKGKKMNAQQAVIWTEDQVLCTNGVLMGVHQETYVRLTSEGKRTKESRR